MRPQINGYNVIKSIYEDSNIKRIRQDVTDFKIVKVNRRKSLSTKHK